MNIAETLSNQKQTNFGYKVFLAYVAVKPKRCFNLILNGNKGHLAIPEEKIAVFFFYFSLTAMFANYLNNCGEIMYIHV